MAFLIQLSSRACGTAVVLAALAAYGLLAGIFPSSACAGDADTRLALKVKAAFVYKFQIYVRWPQSAFPAANAPFLLCIVGATPAADLIERAVRGQAHETHPIRVTHLAALTAASRCHEAVIGPADPRFIRAQLAAASSFATLTVTDTLSPARGVIDFMILDDAVRFAIDEALAGQLHLSISSKLMRIAVTATEG